MPSRKKPRIFIQLKSREKISMIVYCYNNNRMSRKRVPRVAQQPTGQLNIQYKKITDLPLLLIDCQDIAIHTIE